MESTSRFNAKLMAQFIASASAWKGIVVFTLFKQANTTSPLQSMATTIPWNARPPFWVTTIHPPYGHTRPRVWGPHFRLGYGSTQKWTISTQLGWSRYTYFSKKKKKWHSSCNIYYITELSLWNDTKFFKDLIIYPNATLGNYRKKFVEVAQRWG